MAQKISNADSLLNLKGIGRKSAQVFERAGILGIRDLIHYFPREYDVFEAPLTVREAVAGRKSAVIARIQRRPSLKTFGGRSITILELAEGDVRLQINWFHMPFLRTSIQPGSVYVFRGMLVLKAGRLQMDHPEIYQEEAYREVMGRMLPVYPLTAGLTNRMVRKAVEQAFERPCREEDFLPSSLREEWKLADRGEALGQIHFPESKEAFLRARRRLAFEEFFLFLLGIQWLKDAETEKENHFPMQKVWLTEDVLRSLPYRLTPAQERVWTELEHDLGGQRLMKRLIQGDVGSGKTILAFLAMIQTYENGYQSALMAPTEVLAAQHYKALTELLEKNNIPAEPILLTGSLTARQKKKAYDRIRSGESAMVIGTHALIQEAVDYRALALVITDEQHRFGVRQRESLEEKGYPPNVLVMSATPIPRTLALMLYGDLELSTVEDKPAERLPVQNCVVGTSYRDKAWKFMEKQAGEGRQAYVICPMVEPNEEVACENVMDYSQKLRSYYGGRVRVGMLHGQMKAREKQEIMEAFAGGSIDILVSTTVVEVGVNVPNATVMLVENAERFGLAQLHQLRGRVGRGDAQSYCIFIQGDGEDETKKRLEILLTSNDGFYIAEEDLRLRGMGDLFGVRQSGIASFQVADIYRDRTILVEAQEAVRSLRERDPWLTQEENERLRIRLEDYTKKQAGEEG